VQHFDEHSHLAKGVRSLRLKQDNIREVESPPGEAEASMRRLCVVCEGVRSLEVWGIHWVAAAFVFFEARRLKNVRELMVTISSFDRPIFDAFASLLSSLPLLESLQCGVSHEIADGLSLPISLTTTPMPLQSLMLVCPLADAAGAELANSLLSCIRPDTLKFLTLCLEQYESSLIDHLLSLSSLRHLSLTPPSPSTKIGFFLSDLLPRLDPANSLYINLQPFSTHAPGAAATGALELRSGSTLTDFLSLLPPCVRGFTISGYHLVDGPLPSTLDYEELSTWADDDWDRAAKSVAVVKCSVQSADGEDEVERRSFLGCPTKGQTLWRLSPVRTVTADA
jgi:hypothetical protein